tara:strand:- start:70 stop:300 length:231 start_codon:yes stop_codon:yes gene_type:complete
MEDSGVTLTEFRTRVLFKALNVISDYYKENWYKQHTSFVELDKYWRLRYPLVFEEAEDEVLLEETKRRMNLTGDTK